MTSSVAYLTLDEKGRATLPEQVRRTLGLRPGDFVLLERTGRGGYELVPASLVPREQLRLRHPAMQKRIERAEEQVATGGVTRTRTPAEAQDLLDTLKKGRRR